MAKIKPSASPKNISKRKGATGNKGKKNASGIKKQTGKARKGKRRFPRRTKREPTGVVYISHIPHGFYEDQIQAYFGQFGKVNAVSVPRSKSGRAKGYAFIEYKYPEIAKIAADTMNNYLMFNRLLKAKYVPPEEQKPRLFRLAIAAREQHRTAADKAELALKHSRKLKNRHLKISLEAKLAKKLLKKKNALMKRAEKLGAGNDFMVEEANVQSIFERKKELEARKKIKSNKEDPKTENGEATDSSEEESSSPESDNEAMPLGSDESLSEDEEDFLSEDEEDFLSESEEEDYKTIISKAKKAAKDILKKAPKPKKNQKSLKGSVTALAPLDSRSPPKNERDVGREKMMMALNKMVEEYKGTPVKMKTPLKEKLPEKGVNGTIDKSNTPIVTRDRKSLSKTALTETTPKSVKKNKASVQTLADKVTKGRKSLSANVLSEKTPSSGKKNKAAIQTPADKVTRGRKSLSANVLSEKTPSSGKKNKAAIQTPADKVTRGRKSLSANVLSEKTPSSGKKNKAAIQTPADKVTRGRKSLSTNVLTEKTPSSVKKNKVSAQTPTGKKSNTSQIVMEVDNNDEEINFKTPPNVIKKFIKAGKDSSKKTPIEISTNRPSLTPQKFDSSTKTPKGIKSPEKPSSPSTPGKKLRHRKLKKLLTPK